MKRTGVKGYGNLDKDFAGYWGVGGLFYYYWIVFEWHQWTSSYLGETEDPPSKGEKGGCKL
jgi:hypothetical protein